MTLIFVLALLFRLAVALTLDPRQLYWPDERLYDDIAMGLVRGDGFTASAYNSTPLWPMCLALLYKLFGHSFLAVRVAQALLGAATCVITAATATRLFDRRAGFWAGLALALYPPVAYLAGVLYMEGFFTFWLAVAVYSLVRLSRHTTWPHALLAGLCLGVTALSRSIALVLIPLSAFVPLLAAHLTWRRRAGLVAVLWLAAVAAVSPWTARNYHVFGRFIPVATGSGLTLWRGNCEFSRGDSGDRYLSPGDDSWRGRAAPGSEERMARLRARLTALGEVEQDRALADEAKRYVRENPGHCAMLYVRKWLTLHATYSQTRHGIEHASSRNLFLAAAAYCPVFAFGLCGLVACRRRWRELRVPYLVWGAFAFGLPLLTTCTRFRLPTDPILIMFAAAAATMLWDRLAASSDAGRKLAMVICAGVALRLAWCAALPNQFHWRDEAEYDAVARNLLDIGLYSRDGTHPTAFRSPGQPLFLAAVYSLDGAGLAAVRVWQTLLWGAAIWLAFRVAREFGASERAALWTAAATAVYPYYVYAASTLFPLTLFTLAMLAGTWGLLRVYNHGGWRPALVAGVGLGAGVLTIPYLLLSVLLAPFWLGRARWRESLLMACVALLLVAPWPLRNWITFGAPVMGTQQNLNLWYGNNPRATASSGSNIPIAPRPLWVQYRDTMATNELAADRLLGEDAWHHIRGHPARTAWLWTAKALNFFRLWPETQTHNEHTTLLTKAAGTLTYGPLLALAMTGWWLGVLDRRRAAIVVIYFATFVAVSAVTISKDRFRMPLDVYLMIFAAAVVERWLSRYKPRADTDTTRPC